MVGLIPGPADARRNFVDVKDGTSALHACPHPKSLGGSSGRRSQVNKQVLVFSSDKLHHLFHSAAYSIAIARNIKSSPMQADSKDCWAVRFFSAILPDSLHTKEVELPEVKQIEREADEGANEFGNLFWRELHERGVKGVSVFLKDVEARRESAIAKAKQVYRETADYNQSAETSQETLYHNLVAVKCASTIIVAGLALPFVPAAAAAGWASAGALTGVASFGIGTTYSITLAVIEDWDKKDSADLVLVAKDAAIKETKQEAGEETAEFFQTIYESEGSLTKQGRKVLKGKHWLQQRIAAGDESEKKMLQYARRLGRTQANVKAAQNAARISIALKTAPYLFFAWSAKDALVSAYDEW